MRSGRRTWRRWVSVAFTASLALGAPPALDRDPEAQALAAALANLAVNAGPLLRDGLDGAASGRVTGALSYGLGRNAETAPGDQALVFPEDRSEALYVYYGPWVPRRGRIGLDFCLDVLPKDHPFLTLFSIGTGGNTCMTARVRLDGRVAVAILTPAETVSLLSEPTAAAAWHRLELTYAPEGALLRVDGAIHDYSTDYSTPYACESNNAFYLGDQPWWDAGARKAVFYPLDSFVGRLDNLEVLRLDKDLPKGPEQ